MDAYREFPGEFDTAVEAAEAQDDTVSAIGTDERRMHVRAYNYWASLLDGRDYPSIEDLEPGNLIDFAPNSVLLDFTGGGSDPATPYIGAAIRAECDLPEEAQSIMDVPSRSLLSRLTDHYLQIIANRAPVGFEAEFENQRHETICYRGILMPFSSDGDTIDFIYGVINWKKLEQQPEAQSASEGAAADLETTIGIEPLELVDPVVAAPRPEPDAFGEPLELTEALFVPPPSEADERPGFAIDLAIGENAGLADRLSAARESAEVAREAEGRGRDALYRALARAYDFALAAQTEPEAYAELLAESGMKTQARAPMTPIVKLVFGIDYDKARLTEYAAALGYAERQRVEPDGFLEFIRAQAGGLKAIVAAERRVRRPEPKADTKIEKAREKLRTVSPLKLDSVVSGEEFALVLTRRSGEGVHEAIAVVEDPALVERAIRRAGA